MVQYLQAQYRAHPHATLRLSIMANRMDNAINGPTKPINYPHFARDILGYLANVLTSKQEIPLDQHFRIHTVVTNLPPLPLVPQVGASSAGNKSNAEKISKFVHYPPVYDDLPDSCLLVALVMAQLYNTEKRVAHTVGRRQLGRPASAEGWIIKNLGRKSDPRKMQKARDDLHERIFEFLQAHNYTAEDFCGVLLDDALREKVDRIGINLNIYGSEGGQSLMFNHPVQYDATRETVCLFLMEMEEDEKEVVRKKRQQRRARRLGAEMAEALDPVFAEDNSMFHVGMVTQEKKFLAPTGFIKCHFCHKVNEADYHRVHVCTARETCRTCRRILLRDDDYVDIEIARQRCNARIAGRLEETRCDNCRKMCATLECYNAHTAMCNKLGYCNQCKKVYRKPKNGAKHRCGDGFCRICFTPTNKHDDDGRRHVCKLKATEAQKHLNYVGAYDLETIADRKTGRQRANAVGLYVERMGKSGTFDRIAFFDRKMAHPRNGILEEDACAYKYWLDDLDDKIDKGLRRKPPKRKPERREAPGGR